ncbi:MAG TPA: hypothetical protein DD655_08465, partial [Halieaceae bacterium]|nr:hypothetical protein [Halieaceae bacterium]
MRSPVLPRTIVGVYSNCYLADLTCIPSPVTPIPTTTSISARKTASTARARSTTTYWQPSQALGGVVLSMNAASLSAISATARPMDT